MRSTFQDRASSNPIRVSRWSFVAFFASLGFAFAAQEGTPDDTDFERAVRPVLAKNCFSCHGAEKQESDLRLDSEQAMRQGGTRGAAVEPGHEDSLLLQAVRQSGELKMPPEGVLSPSEVEALTRWVVAGASWPEYKISPMPKDSGMLDVRSKHWAYQPLMRAEPQTRSNDRWSRNEIDGIILDALDTAHLQPSPAADKRTLIRRMTYDLIGLPPTVGEVDAFLNDTSPEAVETLIDRLLASPRYGERWARHWLDVVRYTDSFDSRASAQTDPVEIWRYRDWVVDAINEDMPYDRFVAYQVAGDLLPGPEGEFNRDGLIATGMLAIGNWPQGDADKQKMVADIVDDQVDVVMRTFLGVTMACARCHDHKFDPFSTEEYYGLAGIFFSSSILPGPGMKTEGSPILHLPLASPDALAKRQADEVRLAALQQEREALLTQARADFSSEQIALTKHYLVSAVSDESSLDVELNEAVLRNWKRVLGNEVLPALQQVQGNFQQMPGLYSRNDADPTPSAVGNTTDAEVKYSTITQPGHSLVVHPSPDEGVGVGWRAPIDASVTLSGHLADADGNCGDGVHWSIVYGESGVETVLAEGQFENGGRSSIELQTSVAVSRGGQLRLTVSPGGDYTCDTTEVALRIVSDTGEQWDLATDMLPRFGEGNPWPDAAGNADVWWLHREKNKSSLDADLFEPWWTATREEGVPVDTLDEAAAAVQSRIDAALADSESSFHAAAIRLTEPNGPYWLASPPLADDAKLAAIENEMSTLTERLRQPLDYAVGIQEGGVPSTEHAGLHNVHVHLRGDYNSLGDLVRRQMPAIMSGASRRVVEHGSGRRDLAEWLTEDCAGLLARVMVNRIWQHHFGTGLVRTPGDFGAQGTAPTHPELLDYLAARFIVSGWSLKAIHREILNSATYQQSSIVTRAHFDADPDNQFYARANRRRLDAETLRDSLMLVTGRLDPTPGGPAFVDIATPRRTLYLRTVRSDLSTYSALFDGADPTAITPTRNESTVALQALFLMNHPLVLTAAKALAAEANGNAAPVDDMYLRLFGRPPTEFELEFADETLKKLGFPETASALAAFAQILLVSNEFHFVD